MKLDGKNCDGSTSADALVVKNQGHARKCVTASVPVATVARALEKFNDHHTRAALLLKKAMPATFHSILFYFATLVSSIFQISKLNKRGIYRLDLLRLA